MIEDRIFDSYDRLAIGIIKIIVKDYIQCYRDGNIKGLEVCREEIRSDYFDLLLSALHDNRLNGNQIIEILDRRLENEEK